MNADHSAQVRLLDLQAADTALAQLLHKRKTLPELAAIAARTEQDAALHHDGVEAQTRASDIAAVQRRLENDVEAVRTRAARDEQRLQAGGLPAKELASLQHEITTLARRQSALEDELLEIMEQHEAADSAVAAVTAQRSALAAELAELVAARDRAFADIDAAAAARSAERAALVTELPAELLALYERAREHGSGIGAAMLRLRRCEGCHMELSGSELAAVRAAAADAVVRCDNCRRILVRTAESGL